MMKKHVKEDRVFLFIYVCVYVCERVLCVVMVVCGGVVWYRAS